MTAVLLGPVVGDDGETRLALPFSPIRTTPGARHDRRFLGVRD
jgi:hypothetical protein